MSDRTYNQRRCREIIDEWRQGREPSAYWLLCYVHGDEDAAMRMAKRLGEQRQAVGRRIRRHGQTCHRCGTRFEPRHVKHRFCSETCRTR